MDIGEQLQGLYSLETLLLSCEHLEAVPDELCLKDMRLLRHVRLDHVFPVSLFLPPGCRLDLKGEVSIMEEVLLCASFFLLTPKFRHVRLYRCFLGALSPV
jgi:hypothetical protein